MSGVCGLFVHASFNLIANQKSHFDAKLVTVQRGNNLSQESTYPDCTPILLFKVQNVG